MLEISNEVNLVKQLKRLKLKNNFMWFISLGIPLALVIVMIGLLISSICFSSGISTSLIPSLNLLVQGNLWWGRHHRKKIDEELEEFSRRISQETETRCHINDLSEIKIIPKNLKLGEDLSKKNIIEIFKEGHYVLIHSYPQDVVIRQYEDEDELHVDVLRDEELEQALTDIYTLPEDQPRKLELRNRDSR